MGWCPRYGFFYYLKHITHYEGSITNSRGVSGVFEVYKGLVVKMETMITIFFTMLLVILTPFALMMLFVSVIMTVSFIRIPFEYARIKRTEDKNKQPHFKTTRGVTKVKRDEPRPETFINGTNRRPVKPPSI